MQPILSIVCFIAAHSISEIHCNAQTEIRNLKLLNQAAIALQPSTVLEETCRIRKPTENKVNKFGQLLYALQHSQNFEESTDSLEAFIDCGIGGRCLKPGKPPFPFISDVQKGWDVRLPKDLSPTDYWITIRPYFPSSISYPKEKEFTFDANITIQFKVQKRTRKIVLNSANLLFDQAETRVSSFDGKTSDLNIEEITYLPDSQQVEFTLTNELTAEGVYNLSTKYQGLIYDYKPYGALYKTTYRNLDGSRTYMVLTHMENGIRPRGMMPCFDEPAFKARFHVSVLHATDLIALSNGMEIGTKRMPDGWSLTNFASTPPMSTYLLAFAIGDFVSKQTRNVAGTLVRVWGWRGMEWTLDHSLENAAKNLDFYGSYFHQEYPLPKSDLLAAPEFPIGAMENWGLVTFKYLDLYYDIKSQPTTFRYQVAETVSHELAHQWFGDLVTMEWWNDLFLNEGFAEYWSSVGVEAAHMNQSFYIESSRVYEAQQTALEADEDLMKSHPIFSVAAIDFGPMTYQKGAALMRMLNFTLGSETLRAGLVNYLKAHKFGTAVHEDLWNQLSLAAKNSNVLDWCGEPLNVSTFANRYFLQQSFPIVEVSKSGTKQRPINEPATLPKSEFDYQWFIPDWVQDYGEMASRSKLLWITPDSFKCAKGDKTAQSKAVDRWSIHNVGGKSIFRTFYSDEILDEITQQLHKNPNVFDANSRSQIIDDLTVFVQRGEKSIAQLLELTTYLKAEMTRGPWLTVSSLHMKIRRMFTDDYTLTLFKRYMLHILTPVYEKLAWHLNGDWDADTLRGEIALQICELHYPNCVAEAVERFNQFMKECARSVDGSSKCSTVSPDVRRAVYCTGMAQNDQEEFNEVLRHYKIEREINPYLRPEQDALRYALSCATEPSVVQRFLDYCVAENDSSAILQFVQQPQLADILWMYLRQNFQAVYKSRIFKSYLAAMAASWNSDEHLEKLRSIGTNDLKCEERQLLRMLESTVMANKRWKADSGQVAADWLWDNFASQERSAEDTAEWNRFNKQKLWFNRLQ